MSVLDAQSSQEAAEWAQRFQRGLAMLQREHAGADHADVALCLRKLAGFLMEARLPGDLAEAALRFHQTMAMLGRLHGAGVDHADVATCLSNLGSVLHMQASRWRVLRRAHSADAH